MAFSQAVLGVSLHFVKITLHFPKLQGETGSQETASTTTQSFEPEDFPETAEKPAIGGLLRLRFRLRGDRFWPERDFGRFVSGPRNIVSPMQIRRW
jgi:hypothetical protein